MIDVRIEFDPSDHGREAYAALAVELFAKKAKVVAVTLRELPGGHAGTTAVSVLLAQPVDVHGLVLSPLLVRVGRREQLAPERRNYRLYVDGRTGLDAVQPRLEAEHGALAAVAYDYKDDQLRDRPLPTLREYLWLHEGTADAANAIRTLLHQTLTRGVKPVGWYKGGVRHEGQQMSWFFNGLLPAHLVLEEVAELQAAGERRTAADALAEASGPRHQALIGQKLALAATVELPHLRIVERNDLGGGRTRAQLCLYAAGPAACPTARLLDPDADTILKPLVPLEARIDLEGDAVVIAALPDVLDGLVLGGRVRATRQGALEQLRRRLGQFPDEYPDGRVPFEHGVLPNLLERYHELLSRPGPLLVSIIHGDMNLSNILLGEAGPRALRPYLIDFDKTIGNGPAVFDGAKLETEYKVHLLTHRLLGQADLLKLEQALHSALTNPTFSPRASLRSPRLLAAYQLIATIRQAFLCELGPPFPTPREYYLALIGYGLTALKYPDLYPERRGSWLSRAPAIEPLARAAYLSAAFAARVIDELPDVAPLGGLPGVEGEKRPRRRRPLVGRDELIRQALGRLTARSAAGGSRAVPLVLLVGEPGSGRGAVARTLAGELEHNGWLICDWRRSGGEQGLEGLAHTLLRTLEATDGGAPLAPAPPSPLAAPEQKESVGRQLDWLRSVLEPPAGAPQPIALQLRVGVDEEALRDAVEHLCRTLVHTPVILVSEQPWPGLEDALTLPVLPLTPDDVRRYLAEHGLTISPGAVAHLHLTSQGRPRLLEQLVKLAQEQGVRMQIAFEEAVMATSATDLEPYIEQLFAELKPAFACRVRLDAALAAYSPALRDELPLIYREVATRLGWPPLDPGAAPVQHGGAGPGAGPFAASLQRVAMRDLERTPGELRRLCGALADWLEAEGAEPLTGAPQRFLVARYRDLAGQPAAAAEALAGLHSQPHLIYSEHCVPIKDLARKLLARPGISREAELLELVGACAAYLGLLDEATAAYEHLWADLLLPEDPAYRRVLARLLQIYHRAENPQRSAYIGATLMRHLAPDDPLRAIVLSYEGRELADTDPARASDAFAQALEILKQSRPAWGEESGFLEEALVLLHEEIALLERHRGDFDAAINSLKRARLAAQTSPVLQARQDNNLGYIYYYDRGRKGDPDRARELFEKALKTRQALGDRVGQVRAAQNLANLIVDRGADAAAWAAAESLFREHLDLASRLQIPDRDRICANYGDLLLQRGDYAAARRLFDSLDLETQSHEVRTQIALNRIWLALADGDGVAFHAALDAALALAKASEGVTDLLEWAQAALAGHLRGGHPLHEGVAALLASFPVAAGERLRDRAELLFAQGLAALAAGELDEAREHLGASYTLWESVAFPYHQALLGHWRARTAARSGDWPLARHLADEALGIARRLGSAPLAAALDELLEASGVAPDAP